MSMGKCFRCNSPMKKVSGVDRAYLNRYIISDSTVYVCGNCGAEIIDSKEYERVRKKIAAIEQKAKIPAVHEMMAKVKFFVL
jgi:hypothetical protein